MSSSERWVGVGVVALCLLVIVGALTWFRWLPAYWPALGEGERFGIDVSRRQGTIDWSAVAGDDIAFAYIKASEGGDFVDDRFEENWAGAGAAHLERGAYHFFTLCRSGADQARNFLATVPADAELPPAIDLELAGNCAARPSRDRVLTEIGRFVDPVEAAGGAPVVLYIGDDFESRYHVRDELDRPVWHRRLFLHPDVGAWWIWQVHGRAHVAGIDGPADLDVMRGGERDLD